MTQALRKKRRNFVDFSHAGGVTGSRTAGLTTLASAKSSGSLAVSPLTPRVVMASAMPSTLMLVGIH